MGKKPNVVLYFCNPRTDTVREETETDDCPEAAEPTSNVAETARYQKEIDSVELPSDFHEQCMSALMLINDIYVNK